MFAAVGLYASGFQLTPNLVVLVGLLAAFGVLDAVALAQIRGIETSALNGTGDLDAIQGRIARLHRILLLGGSALGILFVAAFLFLLLG